MLKEFKGNVICSDKIISICMLLTAALQKAPKSFKKYFCVRFFLPVCKIILCLLYAEGAPIEMFSICIMPEKKLYIFIFQGPQKLPTVILVNNF